MLIPGLRKIKCLAAGANHVLALDFSSRTFSWGIGENGELGHKPYTTRSGVEPRSSLTPSPIYLPGVRIASISCGLYHSFAITTNGDVYGWGLNNYRQTGLPASTGVDVNCIKVPTLIHALEPYKIREIRGGFHHSLACCDDGTILAWGRCHDAQMGFPLNTVPGQFILLDGQGRPETLVEPMPVPSKFLRYRMVYLY